MIIPFEKVALRASLVLALCASCTAAAPPPVGTSAPVAPHHEEEAWRERVEQATRRRQAITAAVQQEDAPRNGKVKGLLVGEQVRAAAALAEQSMPVAPYREAELRRYEAECTRLEDAYLASQLESTDPPSQAGPWSIDDGRDVLGSPSVAAKLAVWQAKDPSRPFAKFAVVRAGEGRGLEVRVGSFDTAHVDIAGGAALSAGLLRSAVINGNTRVVVVENTSGGYRPGPLRNRTTLAALEAAGYLPASQRDLTVHDNPTGGYDGSKLIVSTKR